jgi:Uma2 family endonuclease
MRTRHKLTYQDFVALPDDGKMYEVLAGELYVVPPPTTNHQRVVKRLLRQLEAFFGGN